MPTADPKPSDEPESKTTETEPEQEALKRAEDSSDDATGGIGLLTGIAQA